MKPPIILICLLLTVSAFASGYEYSVTRLTSSHMPMYSTEEYILAQNYLNEYLADSELVLKLEVFVVPSVSGYSIIIGKIDKLKTIDETDIDRIKSQVRDALIRAKKEKSGKQR